MCSEPEGAFDREGEVKRGDCGNGRGSKDSGM